MASSSLNNDDPDRFFQTTDSIAERSRKAAKLAASFSSSPSSTAYKNVGSPIRLPSKILAVVADPLSDEDASGAEYVFVAQAAGTARRVRVVDGSQKSSSSTPLSPHFTGPSAPLTCLAITPKRLRVSDISQERQQQVLYAGCWDHAIWSWNTSTRQRGLRFRNGHRDFVKALTIARVAVHQEKGEEGGGGASSASITLLISGGADSKIIIWNAETGARLKVLDGHVRGVLALAVDPVPVQKGGKGEGEEKKGRKIRLFSASSDREIKRWNFSISPVASAETNAATLQVSAKEDPFPESWELPHPTSVHALSFGPSLESRLEYVSEDTNTNEDSIEEEEEEEKEKEEEEGPDLWTASADGTVKCLSRSRAWEVDTVLEHFPGHSGRSKNTSENTSTSTSTSSSSSIRCLALSPDGQYVVSGGRDEDLWLWEAASGGCVGRWVGHADEVTGVVILAMRRKGRESRGQRDGSGISRLNVISVSLDGTVRRWCGSEGLVGAGVGIGVGQGSEDGEEGRAVIGTSTGSRTGTGTGKGEEREGNGDGDGDEDGGGGGGIELTAEEEAELAELADLE